MAEIKRLDPCQPDNLMRYHIALSLVDSLGRRGFVSKRDKDKLHTKIAEIYHLSKDSIYAA